MIAQTTPHHASNTRASSCPPSVTWNKEMGLTIQNARTESAIGSLLRSATTCQKTTKATDSATTMATTKLSGVWKIQSSPASMALNPGL